jgi:hypothetical protein
VVLVALAAASIGVLAFGTGTASASTVQCIGGVTFTDKIPDTPRGLEYTLKCDQDIKAFSIYSTKQLAYFSTEVIATDDAGNGGGGLASCEGPIPGYGFGCNSGTSSTAHITNNYTLTGQVATLGPACDHNGPDTRLFASVTSTDLTASGAGYTTSSQPFRLKGPDCSASPAGGSSSHSHHHTHHHKG